MPTEITVRGAFSAFHPPERGTVRAGIAYEGPDMGSVYDRVAHDFGAVKASVTRLQSGDPAPVTWWSAEQLRTWSRRPWHKDGKQLPLVHHASVNVEVKFRDFGVLSQWVGEHIANTGGFRVAAVNWALTAVRRETLTADARTRAVRDAVARAQQYADALELGTVRPVAIADAGMLGAALQPEGGGGATFLRAAAAAGGGGDVELLPEDIEVTATVDARFLVGEP